MNEHDWKGVYQFTHNSSNVKWWNREKKRNCFSFGAATNAYRAHRMHFQWNFITVATTSVRYIYELCDVRKWWFIYLSWKTKIEDDPNEAILTLRNEKNAMIHESLCRSKVQRRHIHHLYRIYLNAEKCDIETEDKMIC